MNMKTFTFLFMILHLSLSTSEWNCETCTAVVSTIAAYNVEAIPAQIEIILEEVCPFSLDAAACAAIWPGLWAKTGAILWQAWYNPEREVMCATTGLCRYQEHRLQIFFTIIIILFTFLEASLVRSV